MPLLYRTAAVPAEITLRGPTSELDQVSSIVAPVQIDGELADTTTVPAMLELRDEEGNVFTPQYTSMDSDSANVTLTVYQVRELPLEVDFIGTPNGFDVESLHCSLSQQTLKVVSNVTLYGPAAEIEELSADSIVAQIDCQSLNLTVGQQTIAVSIQIPSSSRIFATGSYTVQCEVTSK